jgi:hypothetical protein
MNRQIKYSLRCLKRVKLGIKKQKDNLRFLRIEFLANCLKRVKVGAKKQKDSLARFLRRMRVRRNWKGMLMTKRSMSNLMRASLLNIRPILKRRKERNSLKRKLRNITIRKSQKNKL